MKLGLNKRCPRCNTKVAYTAMMCPSCQLNYNKFEMATNKEAKEAFRNKEKDQVLLRKGRPVDVKLWKLLLIAIFLGFAGGHHYYVGRVKMGMFYSIFFMVGLANAILNITIGRLSGNLWELFSLLVLVWGAVLAMWIVDVAKICLNKFKIPVSLNR